VNFTLRPLRITDLTDAIAITVENFTIDGNTLGQYAAPRVRERLASSFRHHEYAPRFLVAVNDDGKIIGVAGWGKLEIASRTWGLFLSSVHRDYRGQGVGTALVRERLRRIEEETQKGRILVSTRHRKRFEKLGFRSVDYDEELSLHLMLKNLDVSRSRRAR
jgi:predicted N-acetyltransferase YhbS